MPILQVRNLPNVLYRQLRERAKLDHRSMAQETIALLEKGLQEPVESNKERRRKLLESLPKETYSPYPDPVQLIREDRNR